MSVIGGPGMAPIVISSENVNPTSYGSTKVKFLITLPVVEVATILLVTLCIRIVIGSTTFYIYFSEVQNVNIGTNPPVEIDALLPNGSIILEATASFDELYPEI